MIDIPDSLQPLAKNARMYETAADFIANLYTEDGRWAKSDAVSYLPRTPKILEETAAGNQFHIEDRKRKGKDPSKFEYKNALINDILALKEAGHIPKRDRNKSTLKAFWKLATGITTKPKPLPKDALHPTELPFDSMQFVCYAKPLRDSYRVYCRRQK